MAGSGEGPCELIQAGDCSAGAGKEQKGWGWGELRMLENQARWEGTEDLGKEEGQELEVDGHVVMGIT